MTYKHCRMDVKTQSVKSLAYVTIQVIIFLIFLKIISTVDLMIKHTLAGLFFCNATFRTRKK